MTPSQLEAARAWLRENWSVAPRDLTEEGADRTAQMIHTLLAATAPPSEEELADEIERAQTEYPGADDAYSFEQGYIAGARREGRK
jgi:hypothetical protein